MMERPGDLVSFVREGIPRICIRMVVSVQDEILACQHEKRNAYDSFAVNAAIAACNNFLDFLIHCIITVYGTSGPSGHGKTTCGDDKDSLKYLNKFSQVMASTHSRVSQLSKIFILSTS